MTTTNPAQPITADFTSEDPVHFTVDVDPQKVATLTVKQGARLVFQIGMPAEEMRRVLFGLHSHLENHQENT